MISAVSDYPGTTQRLALTPGSWLSLSGAERGQAGWGWSEQNGGRPVQIGDSRSGQA